MEDYLKAIISSEELKDAHTSLLVTEGDKRLISHHSKLALIPASNTKLFVSAAALLNDGCRSIFPPLQTFSDGPIDQGILNGNLIIDSCGSLIFTARFLTSDTPEANNQLLREQVKLYAKQLSSAGIRIIQGDIRLSFKRWNAPHENAHYKAATAFSFHENTVDTWIEESVLKTTPESPASFRFEATRTIETQNLTDGNCIHYNARANSRDFWRISSGSAINYALEMLKSELRKQGIQILENALAPKVNEQLLFETQNTLEVGAFINPLNKYSDNFRAELLALLLARTHEGTADYSCVNRTLQQIFTDNNLHFDSLEIYDGSGLSRLNRVSAHDVTALLQFMETHDSFELFKNSMSIAGRTGTLENRFKGTPWEGNFYGKTGTLNRVTSLSGYWFRDNQPTITFSFIGNGAENEVFWKTVERLALGCHFLYGVNGSE